MSRRTMCTNEDRIMSILAEEGSVLCTGCGSMDSVRFGRTARGTQRYRCSACGRTFVYEGPKAGTKLDDEIWAEYARCHARGASIGEVMSACGVSRNTAYRMRHRVDEALLRGCGL